MLTRIVFLCLFVALYATGSSLSCRGMKENFRKCSNKSLVLIETLADGATISTDNAEKPEEGDDTVDDFPRELYNDSSKASVQHKLGFTVQVLEEVVALFKHASAPWDKITLEHFLIAVNCQAEALHPCIGSHRIPHKKLHMYFKRLSHHVLEKMGHSAGSWELIRTEIKTHLQRVDLLLSPILNAN